MSFSPVNVNVTQFCLTPAEDVMMETVVEVSTECGPIEEESFPIPSECEPAAKKKRGQCRCLWWNFLSLNIKVLIVATDDLNSCQMVQN